MKLPIIDLDIFSNYLSSLIIGKNVFKMFEKSAFQKTGHNFYPKFLWFNFSTKTKSPPKINKIWAGKNLPFLHYCLNPVHMKLFTRKWISTNANQYCNNPTANLFVYEYLSDSPRISALTSVCDWSQRAANTYLLNF